MSSALRSADLCIGPRLQSLGQNLATVFKTTAQNATDFDKYDYNCTVVNSSLFVLPNNVDNGTLNRTWSLNETYHPVWNFSTICHVLPRDYSSDMSNDYNPVTNTTVPQNFEAFAAALAVNAATFLVLFVAFVALRQAFKKIYSPRTELLHLQQHTRAALPRGVLAWIMPVVRVTEEEVVKFCGLDATVMLRVYVLGVKFFSLISIYGFAVLVPLNYFGGAGQTDMSQITIANVPADSNWLVAHLVGAYLFSLTLMYMLHSEYQMFLQLRTHYLQEGHPEGYSVFVRDIPDPDNNDVGLYRLFNFVYPGKIITAVTHKDTSKLNDLVDRQKDILNGLEKAVVKYAEKGVRPTHRLGFMGCFGEKVDSLQYYAQQLAELNQDIAEEQRAPHASLNCGFVTFNSLTAASSAAQAQFCQQPSVLKTSAAMEPRDVHWQSLDSNQYSRVIRRVITEVLVVLLCFTYSIPIGFVQVLTSEAVLREYLPGLDFLWDNPKVMGFIQGYVPTITLSILLILIPIVCMQLSIYEGHPRVSSLEYSALGKVFTFKVFSVLLVSTISGSLSRVADLFGQIAQDPLLFVQMLGKSIVGQATFYINYMMLRTLSGFAFKMVNFGQLFLVLFFRLFAGTRRQVEDAYQPPPPQYHIDVSDALLMFAIGLTYACIAPFILPFCVLYFSFGYFVNKYFFLYVHINTYESGGLLWPRIFSRVLVGLMIGQCGFFGYLLIKLSPLAVGVPPLLLLTVIFYKVERDHFRIEEIPLLIAMDMDEDKNEIDGEGGLDFLDRNAYCRPNLTQPPVIPEIAENGGDMALMNEMPMFEEASSVDVNAPAYEETVGFKGKSQAASSSAVATRKG